MDADKQQWSFRVDSLPIPQPRPRVRLVHRHAQAYTPSDHPVHDFKLDIKCAAEAVYDGDPFDLAFRVNIVYTFKRPGNKIYKRQSMPNEWKLSRPDLDNLNKAVLDALTGIFWTDDSRVVELSSRKLIAAGTRIEGRYSEEKCGCEIRVERLV